MTKSTYLEHDDEVVVCSTGLGASADLSVHA